MLKKTMTYIDFDGNEREEDFYFHLTEADIVAMDLSADGSGGLAKLIEKIAKETDGKKLIETFKGIILAAYGEKSPDGKRFIKNQEISDAFAQTQAYSDLFMQLATDAEYAGKFINQVCSSIEKTGEKITKIELPQQTN